LEQEEGEGSAVENLKVRWPGGNDLKEGGNQKRAAKQISRPFSI